RLDGVELRASDQLHLHEPDAALAIEPRLVEHRAGLADDRGLLRIDALVGPCGREPEPDTRLLQRGFGLVDPDLEVALVELADHLRAFDAGAQINGDLG